MIFKSSNSSVNLKQINLIFSGASDASDGQTMQDAPSFGDDDWSIYSYSKAN